MVAEQFTELQKAVGPEITKTDLVPAFQVDLINLFEIESMFLKSIKILKPSIQLLLLMVKH